MTKALKRLIIIQSMSNIGKDAKKLAVRFIKEITGMPLATYAASSAFFLFMSLLPFLLLLSLLVPNIGMGAEELIEIVTEFTPDYIDDLIAQMIRDTFSRSSGIVPVSVVVILWSAAMSMNALGDGLRLAYDVKKKPNYIVTKLFSMLYTVAILFFLLASMLLVMFGKRVLEWFGINEIRLPGFLSFLLRGRFIIFLIIGILFLLILYTLVSGVHKNPGYHLPGAAFTLIAWLIFSGFFSLYLNLNTSYGTLYGSMSVLVVMLLWLYFSVYILLLGARINAVNAGEEKMI